MAVTLHYVLAIKGFVGDSPALTNSALNESRLCRIGSKGMFTLAVCELTTNAWAGSINRP